MGRFYVKNGRINMQINPILKTKFEVSCGFLTMSEVLGTFIQDYVRKFEDTHGVIPVCMDKNEMYDFVTKIFGVKINEDQLLKLWGLYPKSRNDKTT